MINPSDDISNEIEVTFNPNISVTSLDKEDNSDAESNQITSETKVSRILVESHRIALIQLFSGSI